MKAGAKTGKIQAQQVTVERLQAESQGDRLLQTFPNRLSSSLYQITNLKANSQNSLPR
ncbi:hypothetical protein [Nostoc sp. 106C]|uniref:hypothetical protein n=1 Tax=Nostoc sp. 106C TaxID=1932667 RepID=UPI00403F677C